MRLTTQYTQYDRLLRPTSLTLPNGSVVTISYSQSDTIVRQYYNGGNTEFHTLLDSYGRKSRTALYNGQATGWYQVDYCYDATGLLQFQTTQYQGNGWNTAKQCSGNGTSYAYDALGQMTSTTNSDGTATRQYNGRAVMTADVNSVEKIIQHDPLGRITFVCEISSNSSMPGSGSPGPCGGDFPGTGFLTNYSYDLANHKTTVTQGVQTRIFQTDAAGRTIYTSEPERGVTNYSYAFNSTGLAVTRTRPKANQTNPTVLTTTITQYDKLGRIVSVSYDGGVTLNKNYAYDMATGWNGMNMGASKGQLTSAWTAPTLTATQLVYDVMGNVVKSANCITNRCGNSAFEVDLLYSYNLLGNLTKDSYFLGASSGTEIDTNYSVSPAGEVTSITNNLPGTTNYSGAVLSNIVNGPYGPTSYQYGNGRVGASIYDTLGRLAGKTVYAASYCQVGCYVYAMGSTIHGSRVTQTVDSSTVRDLTMGYDEFNRLVSATDSTIGISYTYGYDRWGNRVSQNVTEHEGDSPQLGMNTATNQVLGAAYDARET